MGASSFVSFLHQNYVDFFGNIDNLANAADYLSLAEPFFDEWTVRPWEQLSSFVTFALGFLWPSNDLQSS